MLYKYLHRKSSNRACKTAYSKARMAISKEVWKMKGTTHKINSWKSKTDNLERLLTQNKGVLKVLSVQAEKNSISYFN